MKNKQKTLRDYGDEETVKISSRKNACTYSLERKEGRYAFISSDKSNRTYKKRLTTRAY